VVRWDAIDGLIADVPRSQYADDAPLSPPDGERWVIADVWMRNRGVEPARLGPSQWTMRGLRDVPRSAESEPMREVRDTTEPLTDLPPNDALYPRLVSATGGAAEVEFLVSPYGDRRGRTVRIVSE